MSKNSPQPESQPQQDKSTPWEPLSLAPLSGYMTRLNAEGYRETAHKSEISQPQQEGPKDLGPLTWEYRGDGLYICFSNPWAGGQKTDLCMFMWPGHVPEATQEVVLEMAPEIPCDNWHHAKKDRHDGFTPCPVKARWDATVKNGFAALAATQPEKIGGLLGSAEAALTQVRELVDQYPQFPRNCSHGEEAWYCDDCDYQYAQAVYVWVDTLRAALAATQPEVKG